MYNQQAATGNVQNYELDKFYKWKIIFSQPCKEYVKSLLDIITTILIGTHPSRLTAQVLKMQH